VLPCGAVVAARPYAALGNHQIAFGRASFASRPFRGGPLAFAPDTGRAARECGRKRRRKRAPRYRSGRFGIRVRSSAQLAFPSPMLYGHFTGITSTETKRGNEAKPH